MDSAQAAARHDLSLAEEVVESGGWPDRIRRALDEIAIVRHSQSVHRVDRRIVDIERHIDIDFHGVALVELDDPDEPVPQVVELLYSRGRVWAIEWEGRVRVRLNGVSPVRATTGPRFAEFLVESAE